MCHCQVCKYNSCLLAVPLSINITSSLDQPHDNKTSFFPSNSASDLKVPGMKGDIGPQMPCILSSSRPFPVPTLFVNFEKSAEAKFLLSQMRSLGAQILWDQHSCGVSSVILKVLNVLCHQNSSCCSLRKEGRSSVFYFHRSHSFFLFYPKSINFELRSVIAQ